MNEPYKVVIADDEMISRGYMELFIKPSKRYEIAAALPFAQDVLAWCAEHALPDLIIMDVMMEAGIDGLTAAGQIKQRYPQVKIIAATSMADADWLIRRGRPGSRASGSRPIRIFPCWKSWTGRCPGNQSIRRNRRASCWEVFRLLS